MWKEPSTYVGLAAFISQFPEFHPYVGPVKQAAIGLLGIAGMLMREKGSGL